MTKYIGLDWSSKGWFGVILDDNGNWDTDLFPSIWNVWKYHRDASRICIDIPIGLPTNKKRACDVEAKEKLGHRQRSVFYTPIRDAVYQQNIDEAKELNEREADFSIQNQAWSIVPRIREVDEFLDMYPSARDRLYETHPEVCFWALNGRTVVDAPKTSNEGIARRTTLLADEYPQVSHIFEQAASRYTSPSYAPTVSGPDDILDALAAGITAYYGPDVSTIPRNPPTDERGLPMRITFPSDIKQARLSTLESYDSQ